MEPKELQALEASQQLQIVPFAPLCRLCATQSDRLLDIFGEEDLSTKINLYLPLKVAPADGLPPQCCWNCASTLLAWHELVVTSVEVDRKLRSSQFGEDKGAEDEEFGGTDEVQGSDENDDCDMKSPVEVDIKVTTTSLNDFESKIVPIKKPTSEPSTSPIGETNALDTYISDIEQQLIVPELLVSGEMDESLSEEDEKFDEEGQRHYFSCQYCPAAYFTKKGMQDHYEQSHKLEIAKISEEENMKNMNTAVEANIKKEKRKHHKIDQDAINAAKVVVDGRVYYHCQECGKNLHSPYTYTWHTRIHTGERPYVCDLCGKQFRVSQGLVRHLRETHEGIKKFPCDICGRMFATRRNVEEHRRIHTNERPYVCDLCGKSFKQKASLFVHKRSHKNYFPFKCSYCNQGFRTKPPLLVHITRHTGEKPYKCEVCGRCFRIKYELKRHRLIHSDEKPWTCSICGSSFRQKRYMRNHMKSNHAGDSGGERGEDVQ